MKNKTILRSFLSVIPLFGMGFLLNSHTHDNIATADIKYAQTQTVSNFQNQTEIGADDEISVSVLSSTVTPTSHTYQLSFKTGGTGYQSRSKSFTVASNDQDFTDYIAQINDMDVADRNALIEKIENGEEIAPQFVGYVTKLNVGTSSGNINIPRVFTRNGLFECNIESIDIASAVYDWTGITSITIPNTIKTVSSLTFEGAPNGIVFNIESTEAVPEGWDTDWLPEGCTLVTGYDYNGKVPKNEARATQSGNPVTFGNDDKNYIIGYYPEEGAKYPLVLEYELTSNPGVKLYQDFQLSSTNNIYDSVGQKISSRSTSLNIIIDLEEGQSINNETLVVYNIFPATKDSKGNFIPDVANSTGLYATPALMFKTQYSITDFINFEFTKVSTFAGYVGVGMNVDVTTPTVYATLNPTYYKNNLENIEKGKTIIRYLLQSLNTCKFKAVYKVGNNLVEEIVPVETPVPYSKLSTTKTNNVVFVVNEKVFSKDFNVKNLVRFELVGCFITVDLFIPETNSRIARSNITTRFGNVVVFSNETSNLNLFDIDTTLIIVAIAYFVIYIGVATALYFYLKNKFKNDEFRRIKTKNYVKKSLLGLVGLGIVLYEIIFIILRLGAFSNSIVVYNPVDPFIIVFGIASVLAIGYFIKSTISAIKAEKQRRTAIKLQLDKDVADDGTN